MATLYKRYPFFTKAQKSELTPEELGFLYCLKTAPSTSGKYRNKYVQLQSIFNEMHRRCQTSEYYTEVEVDSIWGKTVKGKYNFMRWCVDSGYFEIDSPSIGRVFDRGNYSPERCTIITSSENVRQAQQKNYQIYWSCSDVIETVDNLLEWCTEYGINRGSLYRYAKNGKLCHLAVKNGYETFHIKQI